MGNYLSTNASGILVGGILAGSLTDSLTPKITFPISMLLIGLFSTLLILIYEIPRLEFYLNKLFLFLFLFCIIFVLVLWAYSIVKKIKLTTAIKKSIRTELNSDTFIIFLILTLFLPLIYYIATKLEMLGAGKMVQYLSAKHIIIFVRGLCIALGMNSAYVAVGNLFRNDSFLATASNYLYMFLFGTLALVPLFIEYLPKKPTFVILTCIMYFIAILLWFKTPATEAKKFNLTNYLESCLKLVRKPEFLAVCFVSMICIGGFYNIIYVFTDAARNHHFIGNLSVMQSIGRQCTFGVLALIYIFNISFLKTSSKNCSQYMSASILFVALSAAILFFCNLNINNHPLGLIAQIAFWVTCLSTGFSQPAAKYAVLSIAQKLGPNMSGAAQSFVTLSNSIIEQQGASVILGTPYPFGSRIYLGCLILFSLLLSFYLWWQRKKVNSYLAEEAGAKEE